MRPETKLPAVTSDCIPPNRAEPVKITGVPTTNSSVDGTVIKFGAVVSTATAVIRVNVLSNQTYPPLIQFDTTVTGSLIALTVGSYSLVYSAISVAFIILA